MATSSKVQFKLETLKEKALEAIDFDIAESQRRLETFGDEESFKASLRKWRARQEQRISDIFRQLGDGGVDDYQLSRFKLDPIPERNTYEEDRERRYLRNLQSVRNQIIAKADSLVPDEHGNVSLTATQLRDYFSL